MCRKSSLKPNCSCENIHALSQFSVIPCLDQDLNTELNIYMKNVYGLTFKQNYIDAFRPIFFN